MFSAGVGVDGGKIILLENQCSKIIFHHLYQCAKILKDLWSTYAMDRLPCLPWELVPSHCTVLCLVFSFFLLLIISDDEANSHFFFSSLRPQLLHMEVPQIRVKSELQLLACATAIGIPHLSSLWNLCHSSWQCLIPNPLSEARDWTCILMDTSRVLNLLNQNGNSLNSQFLCLLLVLSHIHLKWQEKEKENIGMCSFLILCSPPPSQC